MKILIVTPAPRGARSGNRTTALRWARILRRLGHRVRIGPVDPDGFDLLVALHGYKSAAALERFRHVNPGRCAILALTGTDLYDDTGREETVLASMRDADWLICLQERALASIPPDFRAKTAVIHQSAVPLKTEVTLDPGHFDVCVLAHLRDVKDPLRAAAAARLLPSTSRVRILHAGKALSPSWEERAIREQRENSRYRWLGNIARLKALELLASSRLLVVSSTLEGGANVVSEAIVANVPVISSRIDGSIGLLGTDYPGYFPAGDTGALAALLEKVEGEPGFYKRLQARCAERKPLFDPRREVEAWKKLLQEVEGAQAAREHR